MQYSLNKTERRVLGALLQMSGSDGIVEATQVRIAEQIGYKRQGGIISLAFRTLEMMNYIVVLRHGRAGDRVNWYKIKVLI